MANLILLRAGFPPIVIGPEQRKTYLDSLETAQTAGSRQAYEMFMVSRLDASLTDYLEHLAKEREV